MSRFSQQHEIDRLRRERATLYEDKVALAAEVEKLRRERPQADRREGYLHQLLQDLEAMDLECYPPCTASISEHQCSCGMTDLRNSYRAYKESL
jgi:hypothetical protein